MLFDETDVVVLMEELLWKVAADTRSPSPATSSTKSSDLDDWCRLLSDTRPAVRSDSPSDSLSSDPAHVADLVFDLVSAVAHTAQDCDSGSEDDAAVQLEQTAVRNEGPDQQVTPHQQQDDESIPGHESDVSHDAGEEQMATDQQENDNLILVHDTGSVDQAEEPDQQDDEPDDLIAAGCVTVAEPGADVDEFGCVSDGDDHCSPTGGSEDDLQIVCTQRQQISHHTSLSEPADTGFSAGGDVRHKLTPYETSVTSAIRYQPDESDQVADDQDYEVQDGVQDEQENRSPSPDKYAPAGTAVLSVGRTGHGPGLSRSLPIRRPLHQYLHQQGVVQLIREQDEQRKRQRKEEQQKLRKLRRKRFMRYEYEPAEDLTADMDGMDDDMEVDDE